MTSLTRVLCALAGLGVFASGCKTSDPEPVRAAGEAPRRPPKTATLYVDSTGEPLETGGKKAEKADAGGLSKGEFSPKDLLLPGMFVLVSGALSVGGGLLIKAVDKKERPSGPLYVASGGDDGTFVPLDTSGSPASGGADVGAGSTGSGSGASPSGTGSSSGGGTGKSPVAPALSSISATAKSSDSATAKVTASGRAVASTPSSILLSMGYASDYSGPSYISAKFSSGGTTTIHGATVYLYNWSLTLDRTAVSSGDRVNVYATFKGLPESAYVLLEIKVYGRATMLCDHSPQVTSVPSGTLPPDGTWLFHDITLIPGSSPQICVFLFKIPPPGPPVLLGHLTVSGDVEVFGDSTAMVTIH